MNEPSAQSEGEPSRSTTRFLRPRRKNLTTKVFEPARPLGAVGDYDLVQQLGRSVFVGHHRVTRQPFAIRLLDPVPDGRPDLVGRQLVRARAFAAIDHPNVVRTIEVGLHEGRVYLVMEHLRGNTLESVLEVHGALPCTQAIRIGMHIARGLEAVHLRGLTHRNLDAETVMLVPSERGRSTIKLVDFEVEPSDDVVRIARHSMSPELCRGGAIDHRTDLYSLGVLLHRVCTLKYPFEGSPIEILAMYRFRSVVRPDPALTGVPAELAATIRRCLAEDPAERHGTAGEVAEALRRANVTQGRGDPAEPAARGRTAERSRPAAPHAERSSSVFVDHDQLATTERPPRAGTPGPAFAPTMLAPLAPVAPAAPAAAPTLLAAPPAPQAAAPTLLAAPPAPQAAAPTLLAAPPAPQAAAPEPIDPAADTSGILISPSGPARVVTAVPLDPGPRPAIAGRSRGRLPWRQALVLLAGIAAGALLSLWIPRGGDAPAAPAAPAAALPAASSPMQAPSCPPSAPALAPDVVLSADAAAPSAPAGEELAAREVREVREDPPRKPSRKVKPRKPRPAVADRIEPIGRIDL